MIKINFLVRFFTSFLFLVASIEVFSIDPKIGFSEIKISENEIFLIAEKIWQNECGKKIESLTCWNEGENFASLGIGHFIWYPENEQKVFKQTFPGLLLFMQSHGVIIPCKLKELQGCPWGSRAVFYRDINSLEMNELRKFLLDTRQWQALFMAERLEKALPLMISSLSKEKKERVSLFFYRLFEKPNGLYALLDYLNFKGEGTAPLESYKGEGWGLLQVLLAMSENCENPVAEFIRASKKVLTQRVANAPVERNEQRWLKGWLNRIDTYQK